MGRFTFASIAVAAAFALSASAADAQTIGFKLGASMSNVSSAETTFFGDTHRKTGFVGGGFIRFGFGRIGIQPEILSVTKGFEMESVYYEENPSVSIEYIAVPVLLHLPLTYGASFAPYIIAGPEFAFDIGCEMSFPDEDYDCDDEALPEDFFSRRSIDIGLSAGGGLAFAMGPGALLLEGRYTWGMTNIDDTPDAGEMKNRSAYFTAGYSIPIGRRY
ncbi:MAG: PorT family protein [Gemmatimonadetes bacterium]|nr:PorT family protein [Gemmatimonadota bacterium]